MEKVVSSNIIELDIPIFVLTERLIKCNRAIIVVYEDCTMNTFFINSENPAYIYDFEDDGMELMTTEKCIDWDMVVYIYSKCWENWEQLLISDCAELGIKYEKRNETY